MRGEEAVRRLLAGEPDALEAVAAAYTPLLNYVIFPILEDEQEREECLADVLHQVWQARERFDPQKGRFTTWLTALAPNAALNRRRAQRCRETGRAEWDETIPHPEDGPEEQVLKAEERERLQQAIRSLPYQEQVLFYRKYYYLQSTRQMSAELGISERAMEGKLYRLRKKLQKALGGEFHA